MGLTLHVLCKNIRVLMLTCSLDRLWVLLGSTFFLRLCGCCCPSWVFPSRSGKASGLRDLERGVLGYRNGSESRESRPLLRTEHRERERMRPVEWMLFTPIIVASLKRAKGEEPESP